MSNTLTWSEAEIFNARYESYDVYRAVVDDDGNIGDYTLLIVLPITYDWDMAILSQTLTYVDSAVVPGTSYAYKVIANASNGAGDPDGDFTQVSNIAMVEPAETFFRLLESGDLRLMENIDARLLQGAP